MKHKTTIGHTMKSSEPLETIAKEWLGKWEWCQILDLREDIITWQIIKHERDCSSAQWNIRYAWKLRLRKWLGKWEERQILDSRDAIITW